VTPGIFEKECGTTRLQKSCETLFMRNGEQKSEDGEESFPTGSEQRIDSPTVGGLRLRILVGCARQGPTPSSSEPLGEAAPHPGFL
jgi:hypothetical protein